MNIDFGRCDSCKRLRRIDPHYLRHVSLTCPSCGSPSWRWAGKHFTFSEHMWLIKEGIKGMFQANPDWTIWVCPALVLAGVWVGLSPQLECPVDAE